MATLTIENVIGAKNLRAVLFLYNTVPDHQFAKILDERFITPRLDEIEKKAGQEMSARYLAYFIQNELKKRKPSNPTTP